MSSERESARPAATSAASDGLTRRPRGGRPGTAGPPASTLHPRREPDGTDYPPIGDYAFLSDCHSAALVSRRGSIDWCAMPRIDGDGVFARLLDWHRGGFCSIAPVEDGSVSRRYLDSSLVLETCFEVDGGRVRLVDAMSMRPGGRERPDRQILRTIEGIEGEVEIDVRLLPRFDYGSSLPWMRHHGEGSFTALGGDSGLVVNTDLALEIVGEHEIAGRCRVGAGQRYRLSLGYAEAHHIHPEPPEAIAPEEIDGLLEATLEWWRRWASQARGPATRDPAVLRSALVVRGLVNAPTGAIAAAATTSLPESIGGERNWDYRFSWIRDSSFAVGSLGQLGFDRESGGFRDFIERTTAGSATEIQPMYGLGGEHLLAEIELDFLEGYRGSAPVRIGNDAYRQVQLDAYGELLDMAWRAAQNGVAPSVDYWRFLCEVVDEVIDRWRLPDRGIWEVRDCDHHFVHSKVMCWAAVDRARRVADHCGLPAPDGRWRRVADEMRVEIESAGFDTETGSFRRAFGSDEVDAALLLLPRVDFVAHDDPRMVGTVDRILDELSTDGGLVRRYRAPDGLQGTEGCFLPCSFWLAEVLARQGRRDEARRFFDRAASLANDLGLFSEEVGESGELLGNFPQGLSHFSHIAAAVALAGDPPARDDGGDGGADQPR